MAQTPPPSAAVVKAIAASRSSGSLLLGGKSLTVLPTLIWDLDEPIPASMAGESKWWEINELTKMDCSRNSLVKLPEELGLLATLTHLDVSNNSLQGLFSSITNLQSLKLLNAEENKMQACPDSLPQLRSLVVLQIGGNRLRHLPDALGCNQPLLASVMCGNNTLEELPGGLAHCRSLTKLDASKNRLAALPPALFSPHGMASSLTELDLSCNQLRALPYETGALQRLRILNLKENKLVGLPSSIGACTSLVELHMGFNALVSLPDEIGNCSRMKTLDVRNNRLTELPLGLCDLDLGLLDLQNNDLRTLPPQLARITTLRSMPLEGNPLKQIRREVVAGPISGLMKFLESRMPEEGQSRAPGRAGVTAAQAAQTAVRSGNVFGKDEGAMAADAIRMISLNAAAAQQAAAYSGGGGQYGQQQPQQQQQHQQQQQQQNQQQLQAGSPGHGGYAGGYAQQQQQQQQQGPGVVGGGQTLSLKGAGLEQLPMEVWHAAPLLGKLDLSGNMLAGMPAGALAPFTALISLNLSQSCLTQWPLPVQPGRMHQLQELILSRNRDLRSMPPPALCALPGLRTLNLSGTPAGAALLCPGSLAFASALTLLDLSNTGLAGFPPDVARLRALRTLNLSGNKIVAVPDEVGHSCQSLEELDLSNNELATLSPYLGQLTQLRSLSLDGNPLRTMRRAVLDKGTLAVLEYLRERCPL